MIPTRTPAITLLGVLALAACQPAAPAALTDADRVAIQAVSDQFAQAMNAGDLQAVGMLYTDDASLMPPNAPEVTGRAAIVAFLGTFPPISGMTTTIDDVQGAGGVAIVKGRYEMTLGIGDGVMDSGKFVEIRRKQADGSWLLSLDMFNSNLPLPAAGTP